MLTTTQRAVLTLAAVVAAAGCSTTPTAAPAPPPRTQVAATPATPPVTAASPAASKGAAAVGSSNPAGLTDEQLVGQVFMSYVYGATATSATPAQREANISLYGVPTGADVIRRWHLGGIILLDHNTLDPARPNLSTGNVGTATQVRHLTTGLQQAALTDSHLPLLIATDQEGGRVQRLTDGVTDRPSQRQLAHLSPAALTCSYYSLGRQLRSLGINQDFAPVADVVRTHTGVIGDRSFGPDPTLDGRDASASAAGLQAAGVLATLKHWPGHGSTSTDSHAALAVIRETAQQWHDIDRAAFAAATATAAAVMIGHLALPAIDPSGLPATLSPVLVTGQLRHGLGYRGLTVTDSLGPRVGIAFGGGGAG